MNKYIITKVLQAEEFLGAVGQGTVGGWGLDHASIKETSPVDVRRGGGGGQEC